MTNNTDIKLAKHITDCQDLLEVGPQRSRGLSDIKAVYLANGTVVFGLMFSEEQDSFLVGACTKLTVDADKEVHAQPITPAGVCRIFKSQITFISDVSAQYRYMYCMHLQNPRTIRSLPDYLTGIVMDDLIAYTRIYEGLISRENSVPNPKKRSSDIGDKYGVIGVSQEAFVPHTVGRMVN